jgi:hypothetical protein
MQQSPARTWVRWRGSAYLWCGVRYGSGVSTGLGCGRGFGCGGFSLGSLDMGVLMGAWQERALIGVQSTRSGWMQSTFAPVVEKKKAAG